MRRLHPEADERSASRAARRSGRPLRVGGRCGRAVAQTAAASNGGALEGLLRKWDETLSNALQLAPQKASYFERPGRRTGAALRGPRRRAESGRAGRRTGKPGANAFVLLAGLPAGAALGPDSRNPCAPRNLRFPATPCALTTLTGAMAHSDLCTRSPFRGRREKLNLSPSPRNRSPRKLR